MWDIGRKAAGSKRQLCNTTLQWSWKLLSQAVPLVPDLGSDPLFSLLQDGVATVLWLFCAKPCSMRWKRIALQVTLTRPVQVAFMVWGRHSG